MVKKKANEPEHLQIFVKMKEDRKKKKKASDELIFVKDGLTDDNVNKFKRGFKWLTVLIFFLVSFAFGLARYNGASFYGLMALYIITYNISIYTHFLDERTEHWLANPKDKTNGLLIKIMALANCTAVVLFISVHTAQQIVPHVSEHAPEKHSQELVLTLWGILGGVTADIATMVIFLLAASFGILHFEYMLAVVIQDTIRFRMIALVLASALVGALWVFDSKQKGLILPGPKIMQAFLALNFVFAVPRDVSFKALHVSEWNLWRQAIVLILGPFILYRWYIDFVSEEPVLNWAMRLIYVVFFCITFIYAPGNFKSDEDDEDEIDFGGEGKQKDKKKVKKKEPKIEIYTDYLINLEKLSYVADFAVRARAMLYMVYVEVPLNIIFGKQKNHSEGSLKALLAHLLKVLFESVCYAGGMSLLLFRPEDLGPIDSVGALLTFLTRDDTIQTIVFGAIAVVVWRVLSYLISYFSAGRERPLVPFVGKIFETRAIPMGMSIVFFVYFMFLSMLAASACFNAFACVVCTDKDDGWFIMLLKRQTFYATTTVACFMLYSALDLAGDSFSNHLQEEADNFYMFVAACSGVTLQPTRQPYERKLRPKLRSVIFFSLFLGLLSVFLSPTEGAPQAKFKMSDDGLSINMFGMTLARDNINHEHVTDYQRAFNHSYSACTTRWGDGLTAVDHAILARMAYFQPISSVEQLHDQCLAEHGEDSRQCGRNDQEEILADQALHAKELADMQDALKFIFPEEQYGKVKMVTDWNDHSIRKDGLALGRFNKYYRFDFPEQKHTVISVQGTDPSDLRDVIVDMRLWFVSGLTDMSEKLIFLMNFLPTRNRAALQWLIDVIQTTLTIDESRLDFYAPVVQYVHEVITTDQTNGYTYITGHDACPKGKDCWTISVAGHSLGGGIASIVGATLGVSSVSYSGPGFFFAKWQFGTKLSLPSGNETWYPKLARAVNLNTVFVPSSDAVPRFDSHIGAIQHTACTKRAPLSCHSISAMVCDLLLRCGDNQDQKRFHRCADACFEPTLDVNKLENNVH